MNSKSERILIVGAGISGPTLAKVLLQFGYHPTLVERAPTFREGGYMIDIWGTGYSLVERLGLLESAISRGYAFDRVQFVDRTGRPISGFGGKTFRDALDGRFFSIPRGELAHAIYDPIKDHVETIFSANIIALREDTAGVDVEFSGSAPRRFDLVVGADGSGSKIRELAFGPGSRFVHFLNYYAASFVADGYPHRDEGTYVSFARPGRQISRYAMRGGRTAFLLIFACSDKLDLPTHDTLAHKRILREQFGKDGWEAPEILARLEATEDLYFDAVSQIRMPHWAFGRVALIGDAAYCPSLLAGAGAAFAMLGAYILAEELEKAKGCYREAFANYQHRMQGYIVRQQDAAVRLASSFSPKTSLGLFTRDCILNLMNFRPIGLWLARRMLGESFPIPDYSGQFG